MKKIIIGIIVLVMSFAVSVTAEEKGKTADVKTDKTTVADNKDIEQKKTAIMKIMSNGQFKTYIQDDVKFCAVFLEDFTKQKGIEHIKPIVETDNYNDPKLQAYFKQCPKAEFNKTVWEEPRPIYDHAREYYATKNFKLFKVNIDNNSKNGDEYMLYAEGYKDSADNYTYGGYNMLDLKNCKGGMSVPTADPFDYKKKIPIENYNGIIKYKGEYYIFDLRDHKVYRLKLHKYNSKHHYISSICQYRLTD